MKKLDIQRRMLIVALMPAAIICTALSAYFILLRYNAADTMLNERGSLLARQLAPAAEYGVFSGNLPELRRLGEAATREADVSAISFYDRDGLPLVHVGQPRNRAAAQTMNNDWRGRSSDQTSAFFHNKIQRTLTDLGDNLDNRDLLHSPPALIGSVTVEMSRQGVISEQREIVLVTSALALCVLILGVFASRRLSLDVTEPILTLQQAVRTIQGGHLEARVEHHPRRALYDLENGVNKMAAALQMGRDLLEQRIAEATQELREKKEEAERTSLAKSRFLAAASHDLRQPLHALTLFTEELQQRPGTLAQRRLNKQIERAVFALNQQMNALLDISRLDLGEIRSQPRTIALDPLIEAAINLHQPSATARNLRLRHVRTRLCVHSDPQLLERMLGNLLANAIRYTERGGILVGARRCGNEVRLEVWDSGIGIAAAQLPLIFQEFYQVGNPERDADKGLGLGLAIVNRLAQILGHSLDVHSRPQHGTVFSIRMARASALIGATQPAGTAASADAHGADQPPPACVSEAARFQLQASIHLLLPDNAQRQQLAQLLHSWGCDIQLPHAAGSNAPGAVTAADVIIFNPTASAAVRSLLGSYADDAPPVLLYVTDKDEQAASAPQPSQPGGTVTPLFSRIQLPLRPARLRALLQQLLKARAGLDNESLDSRLATDLQPRPVPGDSDNLRHTA